MVRSQKNATDGSPKKKATPKKRSSSNNVWPCTMDGCGKQFAREADLKRHQRTTKTHSSPGFQCPQCDATFTRTDALRRHQKSRHNGVVIELDEKDGEEGVASHSRNGSPPQASTSTISTPAGPVNKYYRAHTITAPPFPPPPTDGQQYPTPIGHPTSSTRHWPPPPPWATEAVQPVGQMPYQPIANPPGAPVYYSPYYRSDTMIPPTGSPNDAPKPPGSALGTPAGGASSSGPNTPTQIEVTTSSIEPIEIRKPSDPVIDPALEQQSNPPLSALPPPPKQEDLPLPTQPPLDLIRAAALALASAEQQQQQSEPDPEPVTIASVMEQMFEGQSEETLAQQYSTLEDAEGETDREDDESLSIPPVSMLSPQSTSMDRDHSIAAPGIIS